MADTAHGGQPPAARGPHACRLALKLVDEALGPVCRTVIACLVDHGIQQYGELVRSSGLPAAQLRAALLVLIQHNYVNCYLKEEPPTLRGPGPSYHVYEAALPRILQSLRVPRFLTHIADELGQESVRLIHNLLEHGHLRWDQLLKAVCSEAAEEGGEEEAPPDPEILANKFRSLVLERYVERAPPCNLPPPTQQVHPNARKRKAAPKPGSEEEADLQREQSEAQQRQAYQEVRFQLSADLGGDAALIGSEAAAEKQAGKRKRGKDAAGEEPSKKRGRKKAGDAAQAAADTPAAAAGGASGKSSGAGAGGKEEEPVLWRVNYDEFNRRFRNDIIVSTVKLKYGVEAGQAVRGLLLANARFEQAAHTDETVVLSVSDASGALRRTADKDVPDNIGIVLAELSEDVMCFLESRGQGPGGEQFVLHIPRILDVARLLELQAVVKNKFGPHGMRIWRLLLLSGQLEQKQVADLAMLTKEDAREKLYGMLKAGYLALQDVPRTADHAPSRTFYTWRANAGVAKARMASDLYRAAGNLHARLAHEMSKKEELVQLLEGPSVASHVLERREQEIVALRAVTTRLEASLLDLDAQIMLFNDV
ncbi:hypothetical protein ABPG77_003031 [Micractinium sp. CCAP 211/92]